MDLHRLGNEGSGTDGGRKDHQRYYVLYAGARCDPDGAVRGGKVYLVRYERNPGKHHSRGGHGGDPHGQCARQGNAV